ncbi:hypothetical protein [Streptomyces sp. NPDC013187]|uniref:hypothetical protein n=1 Tax=Streptomyces sp. NPDC013187 TaxID=3364865 RepID=UPI0036CA543A
MNTERKPQETKPSSHVCRSCKQPVDTVVERHKTMGMYVPIWAPGPCHNPRCRQYVPEQAPVRAVRVSARRT